MKTLLVYAKLAGLLVCLFISAISPSSAGTNQWSQIGPQVASLNALAIDPSNPFVFYSASGHSISKSIDGGSSWSRLSEIPKSTADYCWVHDLAIHPLDFAIYAGTCEGVFKSADGGISWVAANSGISTFGFNSMKISTDPANASVLYIASYGAANVVFKTIDGGASWIRLQVPSASTINIDPLSPSTLFIGSPSGVYKSTDGGNSWNDSSVGISFSGVNDIKIAGNVLYAATDLGVYKSVNGGSSWSLAGSGMPDRAIVMKVATGTGNPTTVYAAVRESSGTDFSEWLTIYRSTDGGANWAGVSSFDESQALIFSTTLAVSPQNASAVFATTRVGLAKSTDGASTWSFSPTTSGLPFAPAKVVGVDSANPYNLYTASVDFYDGGYRSPGKGQRSPDKGQSWLPLSLADGRPVFLATVSKNYPGVVYGTSAIGFVMSSNYGLDWNQVGSFVFEAVSVLDVANAPGVMYIADTQCAGIYGCFHSIMKTLDYGVTWSDVTNGAPYAGDPISFPMISDPGNPNIFYVGGSFGVYKTTNDCGAWGNYSSGLPAGTVSSLAMDPANPNVLYAGIGYSSSVPTGGGVYKSTDGAVTWSAVNAGLTNLVVTSLAIDSTSPSTIYAATDGGGVFLSTNGGASWSPVNSGLSGADSLSVNSIVLDALSQNMFIGTNAGAYSYTFGTGAQSSEAIEFYKADIDHYFMTASLDEAAYLDNKPNWGWARTGKTFNVWLTQSSAPGGASPVCRFYGVFANGATGSHFYTADPGECAYVKGRLDWGWGYEGDAFYAAKLTGGSCPAGTSPVYRVFNNGMGGAPNHRYMTSRADVDAMVARGWVYEGAAFCGGSGGVGG